MQLDPIHGIISQGGQTWFRMGPLLPDNLIFITHVPVRSTFALDSDQC